jgi:hypothetical protein
LSHSKKNYRRNQTRQQSFLSKIVSLAARQRIAAVTRSGRRRLSTTSTPTLRQLQISLAARRSILLSFAARQQRRSLAVSIFRAFCPSLQMHRQELLFADETGRFLYRKQKGKRVALFGINQIKHTKHIDVAPALARAVIYNFTRRARAHKGAQDKFEICEELARYALSIFALHSCMMMDLCVWFIITAQQLLPGRGLRSARARFLIRRFISAAETHDSVFSARAWIVVIYADGTG